MNEPTKRGLTMRSNLFRTARMGALAVLLACTPALAQKTDDEAAFDDALGQFGYAGGAAWQCSEEGARDAVLGQVTEVFHRLTQLFGTDRAFTFAAAFGAGTVDTIDAEACDGYVTGFADGLNAGIPDEGAE